MNGEIAASSSGLILRFLLQVREAAGPEPRPSAGVVESQSVKTTESGRPQGYDAAKKIKGRKRHVVTDTAGLLVGAVVHPADIQNRDGAGLVIAAIHQLFEKYIMELNRRRRLIWSNKIRLAPLALWILLLLPAFVRVGVASTGLATLPGHFGIGLKNGQLELTWMTNSGVPWDYRNTYVNPGWESWNSPSGSFVLNYAKQGYIPIFTWYLIGGSSWGNPSSGLFTSSGLQSASNMNGVFTSFVLALQNAAASGVSPIIFHIEPDLWGFMEQHYGDDATRVPVSVGSSGYAAVANFANNAAGFAQALVSLRNTYAPGVILAWHASDWGPNNGFDPTLTTFQSYNTPQVTGQRVATFYKSFGASFDMVFHDPSDADSAYKVLVRKQSSSAAWWTNTALSNYLSYVGAVYSGTGLQSMLWQVPSGNTLYLRVNNTTNHYQDNRPQYFLRAGNRYQNISNFVGQGVIGLLFGFGGGTTDYMDGANDGITNPPAICGNPFCSSTDRTTWNTTAATVADDDGGFLRSAAAAYYAAGPIATSSTTTASLAASPTSITSGQSSTLSWTSTNASSCTGTNFAPTGVSGSVTVSPAKSTTYGISCTGTRGSANASASIQVSSPPTASLTASPTRVTFRQSSTLTWSSTNATSCTGGNFTATGASGSVTVSPTKSTTYRISCTGTGGSASASALVPVKRH